MGRHWAPAEMWEAHGGVVAFVAGLREAVTVVNDAGVPLLLLPAGEPPGRTRRRVWEALLALDRTRELARDGDPA